MTFPIQSIMLIGGGQRAVNYLIPAIDALAELHSFQFYHYPSRSVPLSSLRSPESNILIISTGGSNRLLDAYRHLSNTKFLLIDGPPLSWKEICFYLKHYLFKAVRIYHLEDQVFKNDLHNIFASIPFFNYKMIINPGLEDLNHLLLRVTSFMGHKYGLICLLALVFSIPICLPKKGKLLIVTPFFCLNSTLNKGSLSSSGNTIIDTSALSLSIKDSDGHKLDRISMCFSPFFCNSSVSCLLPTLSQSIISRILYVYITLSKHLFTLFGF